MKPLNLLFLCLLAVPVVAVGASSSEDFSVRDGWSVDQLVERDPDWHVVPGGGAVVTDADWVLGGQSLLLLPGAPVVEAARNMPMVGDPLYLEVWIRPAADNDFGTAGIDVEGARVRFIGNGATGTVIGGSLGEYRVDDYHFGTLDNGLSDRWIHVVLEVRREEEHWSLALDGDVVLKDIPAVNDSFPREVVFFGHSAGATYIDGLRIGAVPPPEFERNAEYNANEEPPNDFTDDSFPFVSTESGERKSEVAYGDESFFATNDILPASVDTVYVNNIVGSDRFDGRTVRPNAAGGGPVASVAAALARVKDGGMIVIYEGAVYGGDLTNLGDRNVRLQTVGNVRVGSGGGS